MQVTDAELQHRFSTFGPVLEVKCYRKGGYGFVQFERHEDAVRAIVNMNGGILSGRALKCSWGRHQVQSQSTSFHKHLSFIVLCFTPLPLSIAHLLNSTCWKAVYRGYER